MVVEQCRTRDGPLEVVPGQPQVHTRVGRECAKYGALGLTALICQ